MQFDARKYTLNGAADPREPYDISPIVCAAANALRCPTVSHLVDLIPEGLDLGGPVGVIHCPEIWHYYSDRTPEWTDRAAVFFPGDVDAWMRRGHYRYSGAGVMLGYMNNTFVVSRFDCCKRLITWGDDERAILRTINDATDGLISAGIVANDERLVASCEYYDSNLLHWWRDEEQTGPKTRQYRHANNS